MVFNKGVKTIQRRKGQQQMVLGKLDIHMQKNEVGPLCNIVNSEKLTQSGSKS